jgi:hypothetical protein
VIVLSVIAVNHDVDAHAEPGQAHDDEQLGEQRQLIASVRRHHHRLLHQLEQKIEIRFHFQQLL